MQKCTAHNNKLLRKMKKVIKIMWAPEIITKAQRMQMKAQKATKSLRTTAKNDA